MCFVVCSTCEDIYVLDAVSGNDTVMYKAVQL
jgi:hypothetical protein